MEETNETKTPCFSCGKNFNILDTQNEACDCDCHFDLGMGCDVELDLKLVLDVKSIIDMGLQKDHIDYFRGVFNRLVSDALKGHGDFFKEEIQDLFEILVAKSYDLKRKGDLRRKRDKAERQFFTDAQDDMAMISGMANEQVEASLQEVFVYIAALYKEYGHVEMDALYRIFTHREQVDLAVEEYLRRGKIEWLRDGILKIAD